MRRPGRVGLLGALGLVPVLVGACEPRTEAPEPGLDPDLQEAVRLYTGTAGQVDEARARTLLLQAVERGHPLSRMWMARVLSRGRMGVEQDRARARALADSVMEDVERLADRGDLEAQFLMGTAYDEGIGRAEDPVEAVEWFVLAAGQGHVLAQHNLGNAYAAGRGVERDVAAAAVWWLRAALQGDALTQLRLGQAYENGRGVPRDLEGARAWYEEAASRGNAQAAEALERLGG